MSKAPVDGFIKKPARDMETAEANRLIPVRLADGMVVEAVLYGGDTLCLSSQAGCALGCPFCASGSKGFFRNLTEAELAMQVEAARSEGIHPARLTLSGVGEPLMNAAVVGSFIISSDIPVSLTTTGSPVKQLVRFLTDIPHNGLTVSLHAGTADTHQRLVPNGAPFASVTGALLSTLPRLPAKKRRKTSLNYLVVAGMNDDDAELTAFMGLVRDLGNPMVNLLMVNDVECSTLKSPSKERIDEIHGMFREAGLNCRRPNPWRRQSDGGCGTLFVKHV